MLHGKIVAICEFSGSILAMIYAILIASNTGNEILGFSLLLISAILFAIWGFIDKRWAFLALQFFLCNFSIDRINKMGLTFISREARFMIIRRLFN